MLSDPPPSDLAALFSFPTGNPKRNVKLASRSRHVWEGVNINNLTSQRGYYKTDGYLRPGNSGGPSLGWAGESLWSKAALYQGLRTTS